MSLNDRVLLDSILQAKHADIAPEMREDDFFELFLAEQLLWDRDLSWEELQAGITGGGDDGGMDAVYVFCNGDLLSSDTEIRNIRTSATFELVVIQAKRTPRFGEIAVEKIQPTLLRLLDLNKSIQDSAALYNMQTLSQFELFRNAYISSANRFPTVDIRIYYGTRGFEVNHKITQKAEELTEALIALFSSCTCSFNFITPSDLVAMARRRRPTTLNLRLTEAISTAGGGFVGLASIRDYFEFISTDEGDLQTSIFESNVRDYEGSSGVNASIKKTLDEDSGEDFWWLNNGVTIIASRAAQHRGRVLTLEYPQIVNGLQTSREIYNYIAADKMTTDSTVRDDRSVLIRVVVPSSEVSRDRIIRATNSQTAIPSVALRATDTIQRDIEDYFLRQGWFYERRKNRYQNENKPISRIVTIPYLAESMLAAILKTPHLGNPRLGGRFLREDKLYDQIFNSSIPLASYLKSAQLCRLVEGHLRDLNIAWKAERRKRQAVASKSAIDETDSQPHDSVGAAQETKGIKGESCNDRSPTSAMRRRPLRPQRYLLPTVMALSILKTTDTDLGDLDISSISTADIDSWVTRVEELDPTKSNRHMKPEQAEALLVTRLRKAMGDEASTDPG